MTPETPNNPLIQFVIPYILIFFIFYFIVLKPQKDKQKERQKLLSNVKKNDEVVTTGGVHGTVVNVKESTVVIRIDDNAKMEVDKESVAIIKNKTEATTSKS